VISFCLVNGKHHILFDNYVSTKFGIILQEMSLDLDKSLFNFDFRVFHIFEAFLTNFKVFHLLNELFFSKVDYGLFHFLLTERQIIFLSLEDIFNAFLGHQ